MNTTNTQNKYPFTTKMSVRITDINYGMHLGHVATAGIFHHARVLFLNENGFDEMNIDGCGLILLNSHYSFKHEAKFNNALILNVAIGEYSKLKFNFIYQALHEETGLVVAEGTEEIACFDYNKRKVTRIPESLLNFCKDKQILSAINCGD